MFSMGNARLLRKGGELWRGGKRGTGAPGSRNQSPSSAAKSAAQLRLLEEDDENERSGGGTAATSSDDQRPGMQLQEHSRRTARASGLSSRAFALDDDVGGGEQNQELERRRRPRFADLSVDVTASDHIPPEGQTSVVENEAENDDDNVLADLLDAPPGRVPPGGSTTSSRALLSHQIATSPMSSAPTSPAQSPVSRARSSSGNALESVLSLLAGGAGTSPTAASSRRTRASASGSPTNRGGGTTSSRSATSTSAFATNTTNSNKNNIKKHPSRRVEMVSSTVLESGRGAGNIPCIDLSHDGSLLAWTCLDGRLRIARMQRTREKYPVTIRDLKVSSGSASSGGCNGGNGGNAGLVKVVASPGKNVVDHVLLDNGTRGTPSRPGLLPITGAPGDLSEALLNQQHLLQHGQILQDVESSSLLHLSRGGDGLTRSNFSSSEARRAQARAHAMWLVQQAENLSPVSRNRARQGALLLLQDGETSSSSSSVNQLSLRNAASSSLAEEAPVDALHVAGEAGLRGAEGTSSALATTAVGASSSSSSRYDVIRDEEVEAIGAAGAPEVSTTIVVAASSDNEDPHNFPGDMIDPLTATGEERDDPSLPDSSMPMQAVAAVEAEMTTMTRTGGLAGSSSSRPPQDSEDEQHLQQNSNHFNNITSKNLNGGVDQDFAVLGELRASDPLLQGIMGASSVLPGFRRMIDWFWVVKFIPAASIPVTDRWISAKSMLRGGGDYASSGGEQGNTSSTISSPATTGGTTGGPRGSGSPNGGGGRVIDSLFGNIVSSTRAHRLERKKYWNIVRSNSSENTTAGGDGLGGSPLALGYQHSNVLLSSLSSLHHDRDHHMSSVSPPAGIFDWTKMPSGSRIFDWARRKRYRKSVDPVGSRGSSETQSKASSPQEGGEGGGLGGGAGLQSEGSVAAVSSIGTDNRAKVASTTPDSRLALKNEPTSSASRNLLVSRAQAIVLHQEPQVPEKSTSREATELYTTGSGNNLHLLLSHHIFVFFDARTCVSRFAGVSAAWREAVERRLQIVQAETPILQLGPSLLESNTRSSLDGSSTTTSSLSRLLEEQLVAVVSGRQFRLYAVEPLRVCRYEYGVVEGREATSGALEDRSAPEEHNVPEEHDVVGVVSNQEDNSASAVAVPSTVFGDKKTSTSTSTPSVQEMMKLVLLERDMPDRVRFRMKASLPLCGKGFPLDTPGSFSALVPLSTTVLTSGSSSASSSGGGGQGLFVLKPNPISRLSVLHLVSVKRVKYSLRYECALTTVKAAKKPVVGCCVVAGAVFAITMDGVLMEYELGGSF
ncbi:unnamed protein product [Amoebophrya sp. A25]|nr:unnamed protein product [Amoebophrya sp. A25]|eukprot:GSA25T00023275001.1